MKNKMVWMDIPVKDLKRASNFYSHLMDLKFTIEEYGDMKFALCPHEGKEDGFCLVVEPHLEERSTNHIYPLVYLNVNGRIDAALDEAVKYGGKILTDVEKIGPWGFRAIIFDSEGNKIALHSYELS